MVINVLTRHPSVAFDAVYHRIDSAYPAVRTFEPINLKVGLDAGIMEHGVVIAFVEGLADILFVDNLHANDTFLGGNELYKTIKLNFDAFKFVLYFLGFHRNGGNVSFGGLLLA